jgi:hypothetical protein
MQETTVQEVQTKFYVIPGIYEKWVNPANKNDKHYRAIFRSNTGLRRVSKTKFKRAFDVQVYAAGFDLRLCVKEGK